MGAALRARRAGAVLRAVRMGPGLAVRRGRAGGRLELMALRLGVGSGTFTTSRLPSLDLIDTPGTLFSSVFSFVTMRTFRLKPWSGLSSCLGSKSSLLRLWGAALAGLSLDLAPSAERFKGGEERRGRGLAAAEAGLMSEEGREGRPVS